jgi:nucleoid DNA-binding protein
MNKSEFVAMVADELGQPVTTGGQCVEVVLECLMRAIREEGHVAINGFGTFEVRRRQARQSVNPLTKAPMQIPASRTVGFRPAKAFKESLQDPLADTTHE